MRPRRCRRSRNRGLPVRIVDDAVESIGGGSTDDESTGIQRAGGEAEEHRIVDHDQVGPDFEIDDIGRHGRAERVGEHELVEGCAALERIAAGAAVQSVGRPVADKELLSALPVPLIGWRR